MTHSHLETLACQGIDHIELYVADADQAACFYCGAFGFDVAAYLGPETGALDRSSYLLTQGDIRLLVTSGRGGDSPISAWVARHGDGVRDVALTVRDAAAVMRRAEAHGATVAADLREDKDEHGRLRRGTINVYGEVVHSVVERSGYTGLFAPGYQERKLTLGGALPRPRLTTLDHLNGCVERGQLERWVAFYQSVLGFEPIIDYTGELVMNKAVGNGDRSIKLPLTQPTRGSQFSHVDEFLKENGGAGVQHLAFGSDDICATVSALGSRGLSFMHTPAAYYDDFAEKLGDVDLDMGILAGLEILVDRDAEGYLLQIFTTHVQRRHTLFCEVIQRRGARGFGESNITALARAAEREKAKRAWASAGAAI